MSDAVLSAPGFGPYLAPHNVPARLGSRLSRNARCPPPDRHSVCGRAGCWSRIPTSAPVPPQNHPRPACEARRNGRSEMTAGGSVRLPTCPKALGGTVSRATRRVVPEGPSDARPLTPARQVLTPVLDADGQDSDWREGALGRPGYRHPSGHQQRLLTTRSMLPRFISARGRGAFDVAPLTRRVRPGRGAHQGRGRHRWAR
jgi:hypothetical protein